MLQDFISLTYFSKVSNFFFFLKLIIISISIHIHLTGIDSLVANILMSHLGKFFQIPEERPDMQGSKILFIQCNVGCGQQRTSICFINYLCHQSDIPY